MSKKYIYIISAFILVFAAVIFFVFKNDGEEKLVPLKANVVYSGTNFKITNSDTIDFIHAEICIDKYFKVKDFNLQVGETYTIWQTEFSHSNGMHYPIKRKPLQFAIWCETPDGNKGFYSKKFK